MAAVTKPIILDETGQQIKDEVLAVATAINEKTLPDPSSNIDAVAQAISKKTIPDNKSNIDALTQAITDKEIPDNGAYITAIATAIDLLRQAVSLINTVAGGIAFTPPDGMEATNVQNALVELNNKLIICSEGNFADLNIINNLWYVSNRFSATISSWSAVNRELNTSSDYEVLGILPEHVRPKADYITYITFNDTNIKGQLIILHQGNVQIGYTFDSNNKTPCNIPKGYNLYFTVSYTL